MTTTDYPPYFRRQPVLLTGATSIGQAYVVIIIHIVRFLGITTYSSDQDIFPYGLKVKR